MNSDWLFNLGRALLLVAVLSLAAPGQTRQDAQEQNLRRKVEDEVARLFEKLRAEQGLPSLTRIKHRQSLEELVCTSAMLDKAVWRENSPGALIYRTDNPAASSPELERIARFKDPLESKNQPSFTRYAVAVWPSARPESEQPLYWVGIQIYMSAWWEFIDNNFTDNRSYKDDWKKLVTPQCRGVD
ncbi:MAG TPA: hypothetical protein VMH05_03390 [Bryobacteraceae bacterium]|nr:hypothetical protein [Bryobacteraceae bacterium]